MDDEVRTYIDEIASDVRPLFDRVHSLVLRVQPAAEVVWSYKMPTYVVGTRRLHVAAWKHGVSLYGWQDDDGFVERHPEMSSGRGTIRLPVTNDVTDDELLALLRSSLG